MTLPRDQLEQVERALVQARQHMLAIPHGDHTFTNLAVRDCDIALTLIRAAIPHSGETDGWLPIQSAPKDGTDILAWVGGMHPCTIARWHDDFNGWTAAGFLVTPTYWRADPYPAEPGSPPTPQTDEWTAGAEKMRGDAARYALKNGGRLGSVNLAEGIAGLPIPRKEPRT
jgi:hypothetical protein